MTIKWILPIKTVSEANNFEHWTKKAKRHKQQKLEIWVAFKQHRPNISLPCHVKITRIAPRKLDFVNLCSAVKYIEDAICEQILPGLAPGRADGDSRIKVDYFQEKGKTKEYAVKIEILSSITS